jgi:trans-aconitate methyltransferase
MAERMPILEALIAAAPFPADAAIDVLDVGSGNGVVAEAVLDAFPAARLTLQDFSEHMLARAREKFSSYDRAIRYVQCDLLDPAWPQRSAGRSISWCRASRSTISRTSPPSPHATRRCMGC